MVLASVGRRNWNPTSCTRNSIRVIRRVHLLRFKIKPFSAKSWNNSFRSSMCSWIVFVAIIKLSTNCKTPFLSNRFDDVTKSSLKNWRAVAESEWKFKWTWIDPKVCRRLSIRSSLCWAWLEVKTIWRRDERRTWNHLSCQWDHVAQAWKCVQGQSLRWLGESRQLNGCQQCPFWPRTFGNTRNLLIFGWPQPLACGQCFHSCAFTKRLKRKGVLLTGCTPSLTRIVCSNLTILPKWLSSWAKTVHWAKNCLKHVEVWTFEFGIDLRFRKRWSCQNSCHCLCLANVLNICDYCNCKVMTWNCDPIWELRLSKQSKRAAKFEWNLCKPLEINADETYETQVILNLDLNLDVICLGWWQLRWLHQKIENHHLHDQWFFQADDPKWDQFVKRLVWKHMWRKRMCRWVRWWADHWWKSSRD